MARDLVTLGEIKELAGVGRPTVSNWRRRFARNLLSAAGDARPAFPDPVEGTEGMPLFDAEEIAEWLELRPIPEAKPDASQTYGEQFRQALRLRGLVALRHEVGSAEQLISEALAVIAADAAEGNDSPRDGGGGLPAELAQVREGVSDRIVHAARELVAAKGDPGRAADEVLTHLAVRLQSDLAITLTPASVVELVSALVGPIDRVGKPLSVINLWAGTGDLLVGLQDARGGTGLVAVERDAQRRKLLRYRLLTRSMEAVQVCADPSEVEPADVVVADLPYAPVERERSEQTPLAWAEEAVGLLNPGGRAYVVVPAWTMARTAAANASRTVDIREWLLARGCVEAIVQLPRRIHDFLTGAEHALLVLRPAQREDDGVLLVDADRMARRTSDEWPEHVAHAVQRRDPSPSEESALLPVRIPDGASSLLLDGRSVLPAHRIAASEEQVDHFERMLDARRHATAVLPNARDWLGNLGVSKRVGQVRHRRVDELLKAGQLKLLPGHRISESDLGESGLPVIGREEMLGTLPAGRRRIALEDLARYPQAVATERGDVLLLNEHGVRAMVDETGGHVLLTPVQGLRIAAYRASLSDRANQGAGGPDALWMRPQALAQLIQAARNQQRASGSLVRRVSVRDMDLPVLPPAEVAELETILSETERRRAEVRIQLEALDQLAERLSAGVADGALGLRQRRIP